MSGHSKWHTIRRSKGVADQRRGQLFTRLARDITLAVKEGGSGDPDMNFRLRLAVDKAKSNNMPGDSIQRAIDRGLGKGNEAALEEVYYEATRPAASPCSLRPPPITVTALTPISALPSTRPAAVPANRGR